MFLEGRCVISPSLEPFLLHKYSRREGGREGGRGREGGGRERGRGGRDGGEGGTGGGREEETIREGKGKNHTSLLPSSFPSTP